MAAEAQLNPTQPVNQQIYRILRRDIVHCLIPPGTPLSEKEVSVRFDVSRQPVREAFIKLAENGLIQIRPQRGSYVNKISLSQVRNGCFVRQAIEIIRENAYQKLSVKDIAVSLSIHENYLSRLFKNDMGISIKEYISEIKISIANDLLSSTEYSIQQISDKIGFSTVQSFSKAFKKANGVSPGVYRKRRLGLGIINGE